MWRKTAVELALGQPSSRVPPFSSSPPKLWLNLGSRGSAITSPAGAASVSSSMHRLVAKRGGFVAIGKWSSQLYSSKKAIANMLGLYSICQKDANLILAAKNRLADVCGFTWVSCPSIWEHIHQRCSCRGNLYPLSAPWLEVRLHSKYSPLLNLNW